MSHDLIVYAFMAINVAVFGWAHRQKRQFTKAIDAELQSTIQKLNSKTFEERGTKALVEHARAAFSGNGEVQSLWEHFENGLVALDPVTNEPLCASSPSDDFLNLENLLSRSKSMVSYSIWNAVPQILTSVGIIGTYASILATLLSIGKDGINEQFILGLVRGLAWGFTSSLVGISLAVLFIFLEKITTKGIGKSLAAVNIWMEKAFPTLTAERTLVEQSHLLKNLSADMMTSISRGFSEMTGSLGPALADVLDDETKKTIKEGVASSFKEMNAILVEVRNESKNLTQELTELRTAKREMLDNVKSMIEEQKALQTQINFQSSRLVEDLKVFGKTIEPLTEVAKQVQATNELSSQLLNSVSSITSATEKIQISLQKADAMTNDTASKFNAQLEKIGSEYRGLVESIEGWTKQSNVSLQNNLVEFDKNIGGVLSQVLALSNSLNNGVVILEKSVTRLTEKPTG